MSFTVEVPGKLMVCGEYAVVRGSPAVCLAVARHARCTFEPAGKGHGLHVYAMGEGPLRVVVPAAGVIDFVPPPEQAGRWDLVKHVLASHTGALLDGTLTVDTTAMAQQAVDGGPPLKLGVGSSAAAAVALTAALDVAAHGGALDDARRRAWFVSAQRAHLAAQGGVGSGVDVATSALGGVVLYTRPDADPQHALVERLAPDQLGVVLRVVWTGVAVSTAALLRKVDAFSMASPAAASALFAQLDGLARQAAAAARTGDAAALMRCLDGYGAAMAELGRASGADIVTEAHQRVREVAARHGCVAKPSGAGGGDVAVVAAPDEAHARDVVAALQQSGLTVVDLPASASGATLR